MSEDKSKDLNRADGKTVLIIEDDSTLGSLLVDKLERSGHRVELVSDGKKGLKRLKELKPDLLLSDIVLPSMNGYQILEEKLADEDIKNIPVIVVSNSGEPIEIDRIIKLGVRDYVIKTKFNPDEIMAKVMSYLEDSASQDSLQGKTVLLIEDDAFLTEILSQKLQAKGCAFFGVNDGDEAISFLKNRKPDIIILDIVLPRMDGYEIIETLKSREDTKEVPVIFLSNLGDREEIEKGKELGADKFLVKSSMSIDQVVSEVARVAGEHFGVRERKG